MVLIKQIDGYCESPQHIELEKRKVRYKVIGKTLGRGFTFNVWSNGRQEAAKDATSHLREMRKDLTYKVIHCTRTKIEISGIDPAGEYVLMALVNPFPEPED